MLDKVFFDATDVFSLIAEFDDRFSMPSDGATSILLENLTAPLALPL